MTTNLGTRDISKAVNLGFMQGGDSESNYEKMKAKVSDELKQHFRPEFLNRIDEIVVFHQLSQSEIEEIVDLLVAQIESRLKDRDMGIELTPAAKSLVAKRGFDPILGARPLRRALQRDVEDSLAEKILFGELRPGQIVLVDVAPEGSESPFTFTGTEKHLPDNPLVELAGSGGPPSSQNHQQRPGLRPGRCAGDKQCVSDKRAPLRTSTSHLRTSTSHP